MPVSEFADVLEVKINASVHITDGAESPEGGSLGSGSKLAVIVERDDGHIHCCFDCDYQDRCAGMVFDSITGKELEPGALPKLVFKPDGARITHVKQP